jgi:hypothetical protein
MVQGISNHCGVFVEAEWGETCQEPRVESLIPVFHKADVLGLQTSLQEEFSIWVPNGKWLQEIWNNYKEIFSE